MTKLLISLSIIMMSLSIQAYEGPEFSSSSVPDTCESFNDGGDTCIVHYRDGTTDIYKGNELLGNVETKAIPNILALFKEVMSQSSEKPSKEALVYDKKRKERQKQRKESGERLRYSNYGL